MPQDYMFDRFPMLWDSDTINVATEGGRPSRLAKNELRRSKLRLRNAGRRHMWQYDRIRGRLDHGRLTP